MHIGGWPADIENIYSLADFSNVKLIEDCSQAHGAGFIINLPELQGSKLLTERGIKIHSLMT